MGVLATTDLATVHTSIGLPSATVERLAQANDIIDRGSAGDVIDVLLYTDALVTVAREKQAAEIAREAASTRIAAARRIGEMLLNLKSEDEKEKIWAILPGRFGRCEELAEVPQRLFKRVTQSFIQNDSPCSIQSVIRKAKIESLTKVEPDIFTDYTGAYWIAEKGKRTHIHRGGVDEARRRLGMRANPGARKIDEEFASARRAAHSLSLLGEKLAGEPRRLVGEAELLQAKVAELLDQALKAVVA